MLTLEEVDGENETLPLNLELRNAFEAETRNDERLLRSVEL